MTGTSEHARSRPKHPKLGAPERSRRPLVARIRNLELIHGVQTHAPDPVTREPEGDRWAQYEDVTINPHILLEGGQNILVDFESLRFRVRKEQTLKGYTVWAVYLLAAPPESGLSDIANTNIYLTTTQIRGVRFRSPLVAGSEGWEIQKRIWAWLNENLITLRLKPVVVTMPYEPGGFGVCLVSGTSSSLEDFRAGYMGMYSFEGEYPWALFRIRNLYTVKSLPRESRRVVEFLGTLPGHPLSGCVVPGTRVPHAILEEKRWVSYRGPQASSMQAMVEFLLAKLAS